MDDKTYIYFVFIFIMAILICLIGFVFIMIIKRTNNNLEKMSYYLKQQIEKIDVINISNKDIDVNLETNLNIETNINKNINEEQIIKSELIKDEYEDKQENINEKLYDLSNIKDKFNNLLI